MLEGTTPWELPECLLGAIRLNHLDIAKAKPLDVSRELPLLPALTDHGVPASSFAAHQFHPEMLDAGQSFPSSAGKGAAGGPAKLRTRFSGSSKA